MLGGRVIHHIVWNGRAGNGRPRVRARHKPRGPVVTAKLIHHQNETDHRPPFGIALEITLQLLPRAECFHTVLAGYQTLEQAGDAVSAVIATTASFSGITTMN